MADLEAVGLALEGITLVRRGGVQEGLRLLDEAAAITAGEELQLPIVRGWALCYLISACEGVGDFPRATQWCAAAQVVAERWDARQLIGVCRSAYGNVLATNGDWAAAELELTAAVEDLLAARPAMAPGGLARLGELRARQGRTDEARVLFERAGSPPARRPRAGLAGARGRRSGRRRRTPPSACCAGWRRAPRSTACRRSSSWCALVSASATSTPPRRAAASSSGWGTTIGTPFVRGRARLAAARVAGGARRRRGGPPGRRGRGRPAGGVGGRLRDRPGAAGARPGPWRRSGRAGAGGRGGQGGAGGLRGARASARPGGPPTH